MRAVTGAIRPALSLLAEISARRDPADADTTGERNRQTLAVATELEMRAIIAHCHLGVGAFYRRIGDQGVRVLETATMVAHLVSRTLTP